MGAMCENEQIARNNRVGPISGQICIQWLAHTYKYHIYIYQIISVQKRSMHNQYNVYIHLFNDLVNRWEVCTPTVYPTDYIFLGPLPHTAVIALLRLVFEGLRLTGNWTSGHSISQGMQLLRPLSDFFHCNSCGWPLKFMIRWFNKAVHVGSFIVYPNWIVHSYSIDHAQLLGGWPAMKSSDVSPAPLWW